MAQQRLTDRTFAPYANDNTIIHIVNTGDTIQYSGGSSYKVSLGTLKPIFTAGTGTIITGGTYTNGTLTLSDSSGNNLSVTGFYTGGTDVRVTGGTYSNGTLILTNNTGGTFSVTGFYTGGTDTTITGGSYSNGTLTLGNNTGGTISVTGFYTGGTDVFVTGVTYNNANTFTFTNNTGGTFSVIFNTVTGLTSTGTITTSVLSAATYQNLPATSLTIGSSSIVSGTTGRVLFEGSGNVVQEDSALFWDNTNKRLGVGTTPNTSVRLDVRGQGALSTDIGLRVRNSADNANLLKIAGNGNFTLGNDSSYHVSFDPTSPSLRGRGSDGSTVTWQLSTWSSENCWITNNPSSQVLVGIGTATPTDKLHIYTAVNDYKIKIAVGAGTPTNESCGIKFSTTWAGTSFGSDAVQIIARSKGSATTTSQRSSLEFLLNSGGTTSLRASVTSQSNLLLQAPTEDTNDVGVIYVPSGTVPTTSITDGYKQYSADIVAGNAAPHFRTENGSVVKLYQNANTVPINQVLENIGVIASGGTSTFTSGLTVNTISATTFNLAGSQIESAWTSYVPVWTASGSNPVIGNGTIEGWYKIIGKTCFVRGNIAMGSSTTFGTGEWYVSMPVTAVHADAILMTVTLLDNGSAWYNATMAGARAGFNNKAPMQYVNFTNGTASDVNSTQPFTWTTSDRFIWNGSYEIA